VVKVSRTRQAEGPEVGESPVVEGNMLMIGHSLQTVPLGQR
jgi:hypothetical protein